MTEKKRSLEDLAAEFELDLRHLPVTEIEPDPENSNEMSEGLYRALVDDIFENGFTQPILVRPVGEKWMIIDGEHRWRAVTELGVNTIPSVVIEADDDDAHARLITMNRFRGDPIPVKQANLIAKLAKRTEPDKLRKRLGMEPTEFDGKLRLANFSDGLSERITSKGKTPGKTKQVLRFSVSKANGKIIERVVGALEDANMERGEALAHICGEYERTIKGR